MVDLVLGILAAVGASTLYSLGVAFQAMDAKEAPQETHLRLALAWRLVRRGRWLLGTGLSIIGWPLQVVALTLAPLVVVQPALAAGLLVLLLIGERMLGERAGRNEHIAMVAIVVGVIGAALCAPPISAPATPPRHLTLALVLLALGSRRCCPTCCARSGTTRAELTMICAGLRLRLERRRDEARLRRPRQPPPAGRRGCGVWRPRAASGVGTLSEMSALQSRPAILVAPVVFVTQTVVPVALAPLLLGEHFSETPLGGIPLVGSLLVLVGGAAALVRSPLLLALMDPQPVSDAERLGREPARIRARRRSVRARAPTPPTRRVRPRARRPRASCAEAAGRSALRRSAPLTGIAPSVRASTS